MAGRKPKLNWTPSRGQYTTTIGGKFHELGKDKEKAEREFRWLLHKHDLQEPVESNPTLEEVSRLWLEMVKEEHDPDRFRLCKARWEDFLQFVGRNKTVRDLRPRHLEDWIDGMKTVTKPGTKRQYKSMILAALNWAASKKVRLIPSNPVKGLVELPEGDSRGGDVVWPDTIFKQVLRVANPAFADVVRILVWTGARPSTVCKVEARHYIPSLKLWDVEDMYRGRKSKRKYVKRIWLPAPAIELVERLNSEHPEGPVFRNSKGDPWTSDTLGVYLYQLQHKFKESRKLKWPEGLCMYGLRHTFATNFIRDRPDKLEYLRELLGHKDLEMIRRHYGHLFDEHQAIHGILSSVSFFQEQETSQ